jgi:hypothetical protein
MNERFYLYDLKILFHSQDLIPSRGMFEIQSTERLRLFCS